MTSGSVAVAACSLALAATAQGQYRAGVARTVITPGEPMWAGGYGGRDKPVSETEHDLYAKALVLEDAAGTRLVIVTTDLLGLPRNIASPVAEAITRRLGIERRQLLLTSSHTHCGPVLRDSLVHIYPLDSEQVARINRYSEKLVDKICRVVFRAAERLRPVALAQGCGRCTFAVNRRENPEAKVGPGYRAVGPTDHDVPVLRVTSTETDEPIAVVFGYACHCTTMNYYKWCGDYAGFAQLEIEAANPGATAMFIAGCGADQNPLPRRSIELCRDYGRQLAGSVQDVLRGEMRAVVGAFGSAFMEIPLAFEQVPGREELERRQREGTALDKKCAAMLLTRLDRGKSLPRGYPYPLQSLQIGSNLTLVALAGEVVVDYSLRLKRQLGREGLWVAAYANDVFAYIPSERVLKEGGYEGDTSMAVYGLASKWSPGLEDLIVRGAEKLVREARPQQASAD